MNASFQQSFIRGAAASLLTVFAGVFAFALLTSRSVHAQAPAAAPAAGAAAGGAAAGAARGVGGGRGGSGTPGYGAPAINLYQTGVVGSRARGNNWMLTDLDITAIAHMEESFEVQANAVTKLRAELLKVSFDLPVNAAAISAKVEALAKAEQALAVARAEVYPKIVSELKLSGDRQAAFVRLVNGQGN
jgi:predicted nucleotidyltransferase